MRVLLLYPWPDLFAEDRGAARRVMPLIRLFREQGWDVTVVSPGVKGEKPTGVNHRNFEGPALERRFENLVYRIYDAAAYRLFRGTTAHERRQLWHYLRTRTFFGRKELLERELAQADAVVLEYPFWAHLLPKGMPFVLTMHDVLSQGITHRGGLRRVVARREKAAARAAAEVVCVSPEDQAGLARMGISAIHCPHGLSFVRATAPTMESPGLRELAKLRAQGKIVAAFVGSSLPANAEAVARMREWAALGAAGENLVFAAAGSSAPPHLTSKGFVGLGCISDSDLEGFYETADLVLSPIVTGTGSSVKVLEAFARGKAVVSTSVGLRGYPVADGREALVEDDQAVFPTRISLLARDAAERGRLGENARRFAEAYDYRRAYAPYLEAVRRLAGTAES